MPVSKQYRYQDCPECGADSRVIDARRTETGMRRRYVCDRTHRFTTYEVSPATLEKMKKAALREEFMEVAQSEMNKAFFRTMERLKASSKPDSDEKVVSLLKNA